jgi:hypothetical protein
MTAVATRAAARDARRGQRARRVLSFMPSSRNTSRPRHRRSACQALAFAIRGPEQRRMYELPVNASFSDIENRHPLRIDGGVGPARHRVGAHAPGVLPLGGQYLLHQDLWTVAQHQAVGSLLQRPAGRAQALAGCLGRLELRTADPELLQADLGERSAAGGVGEPRHPVRAHAAGEGEPSVPVRQCCRGVGGGARGCGRAELRHLTPRRAAA